MQKAGKAVPRDLNTCLTGQLQRTSAGSSQIIFYADTVFEDQQLFCAELGCATIPLMNCKMCASLPFPPSI
jgi:hypothetical protein